MNANIVDQEHIYDDILTIIASKSKNIENMLDIFFDFLHRKTDFYVEYDINNNSSNKDNNINYKMGFPKGIAEKMILRSFHKYPSKDYYKIIDNFESNNNNKKNIINKVNDSKVVNNINISKNNIENIVTNTELVTTSTTTPNNNNNNNVTTTKNEYNLVNNRNEMLQSIIYTEDGKQIPIGNGGLGQYGIYYWTQTLKDITIYIDCLPYITTNQSINNIPIKSKDINCIIKTKSLYLEINKIIVIDGFLEELINLEESMWTLSTSIGINTSQIVVTLEKLKKTWWKSVILGN